MDIQKLNEKLDEKIPRDCVSTREAGNNKKLSYLETHYVIDRMNKVFGNLSWSCETVAMTLVESSPSAYVAKVRLAIHREDGLPLVVKEGYGYGVDKPRKDGSVQNPHEMAIKEAESDAFKRAAKNLGQSMGLALYDKTQENVEDSEQAENAPRPARGMARHGGSKEPVQPAIEPKSADASIDDIISSLGRVIIAKKKATLESLKAMIKAEFGVDNKSELTPAGKEALKTRLEGMLS